MSNHPPRVEIPRFLPEVLPVGVINSSGDPDAARSSDSAIPGTYAPAIKPIAPTAPSYNPCKSFVFRSVPGVNFDLIAYIVIGLALFLFCAFLLSSTIGTPSGGGPSHYSIYLSRSMFLGPIVIFIGGLISAITLAIAAYQVRSIGIFALFLLAQVALVFWYFNLMFRIEQIANGGNSARPESTRGNGVGYLVIALFLMLGMVYMAWGRNISAALLMLVPVIWYSIVFYFWLNDGI